VKYAVGSESVRGWRGWVLGWLILLLAVPLTGCFSQEAPVDPSKQLTEFTKPAVVRIVSYNSLTYHLDEKAATLLGLDQEVTIYDGGTGSGAIVTPNGHIVTNAHVIEAAGWNEAEAKQRIHQLFLYDVKALIQEQAPEYQVEVFEHLLLTTQYGAIERVHKVVLPGGDEYPFFVRSYGKPMGEGKDVAILKIEGSNLPSVRVDEEDRVQTADKIVIAGYPGKADLGGYLDEESALVSTYTNGAIAARKNSENGPLLQLDANVNPGNSGGPVFTLDGKMVGIATATSNDGIGWAVPASTILEFTKQADVTVNEPNTVTTRWQEGLQFYWQGHTSKAVSSFREVKRLYPTHYEIDSYLNRAKKAVEAGDDRIDWSDYSLYLIAGGTLLVVALSISTIVWLRLRAERQREDEIDNYY